MQQKQLTPKMANSPTHFLSAAMFLILANEHDTTATRTVECYSLAPSSQKMFHCFNGQSCVDPMGGKFEFLCAQNRTPVCPDGSDQSKQLCERLVSKCLKF